MTRNSVAIIGAGETGAGWAARFLLMGWNVRVFDPDPAARARVRKMCDRARATLPSLYEVMLPDEGDLSFHAAMSDCVVGVSWVQESAPDRLVLKRKVFQVLQAQISRDVPIASSSASLPLASLQGCANRPESVLRATPVKPVYLIPQVEISATPAMQEAAEQVLRNVGMNPVDTGPTVADRSGRMMSALRKAADTALAEGELKPGELERLVAGGIGPALAAGLGLVEDEMPSNDSSLAALFRAFKGQNHPSGKHLSADDIRLRDDRVEITVPILTVARAVPVDWGDYNGHMTEAKYLHAFGNGTDRFMEIIGVDDDYIASGGSFFTAETHIRHLSEAQIGEPIRVTTTCLGAEGKRMHLWHEMYSGNRLLATGEHMLIHVSLETRKPAPPAPHIAARLAEIAHAHGQLPRPEGVGRAIGRK